MRKPRKNETKTEPVIPDDRLAILSELLGELFIEDHQYSIDLHSVASSKAIQIPFDRADDALTHLPGSSWLITTTKGTRLKIWFNELIFLVLALDQMHKVQQIAEQRIMNGDFNLDGDSCHIALKSQDLLKRRNVKLVLYALGLIRPPA